MLEYVLKEGKASSFIGKAAKISTMVIEKQT
jgi:hypothetical protein